MTMTEKHMQLLLFDYAIKVGLRMIVPNFTPHEWFECDVFGLTKAGHGVEFEIKLTTQDFRADRKKVSRLRRDKGATKHALLNDFPDRGPRRFFYVAPSQVIPRQELPAWAGLIELPQGRSRLRGIVDAPARKSPQLSDKEVGRMRDTLYWRYWSMRQRLGDNFPPQEEEDATDEVTPLFEE